MAARHRQHLEAARRQRLPAEGRVPTVPLLVDEEDDRPRVRGRPVALRPPPTGGERIGVRLGGAHRRVAPPVGFAPQRGGVRLPGDAAPAAGPAPATVRPIAEPIRLPLGIEPAAPRREDWDVVLGDDAP